MGRKSLFDQKALAVLLMKQNGVITRGQAGDCGMSRQALEHRVRVGGPWQPLLPGVYMTNTGTPTGLERLQAALLYAGPGSAITGPAALALHHIRARQILVVDVLIPDATLARDARMSARGIIVLHFPPRRLRTDSAAVAAQIRSALDAGHQRGRLGIRAVAC
jgi:hypothetical protein